jgi:flagellar motor switch protein FliN/FliY
MSSLTTQEAQKTIALIQTELGKSLNAAFASMAGDSSIVLVPALGSLTGEFVWIRQDFEPLAEASLYLGLRPTDRLVIGRHLLAASGLDGDADDLAIETVGETLKQGASALCSLLSARFQEQVSAKLSVDPDAPKGNPQFGFQITGIGSDSIPLAVIVSDFLLTSLMRSEDQQETPAAALPVAIAAGLPNVNNLELLLDVEMPVTISFGRTQLPLKDVLKLSIGALVELDRTVSDPVDIIVSNSVIARGEVVIVDGNLGVRIDQVMSRQERLRNLV